MDNNYEDDPELLKGISEGNAGALASFLDVNRRQLMAFISRRLGDALRTKVEVEDIFQDVSAEAIRTLTPEWPGEREPFSWLCHLSERKIVDAHRHHFGAQKRDAGKERALDARSPGGGEIGLVNILVKSMTTPSAAFSRNAREGRLHAAIAELNDDQRESIRLKYIENKPSKEIAKALGRSDAAVRVMLTRTMKQLHELLADG
ncbi:MAG: sigma-70 family RNA polymerase sigma factor [Fuerstiella sp.]|jgi:RNA polymerase sigma-70 factor (ECF subfamily)|nr:sigma-70 family RNA polymerase sigma factor [Fuerstiella sp.]MCP4510757.1 sigma-70 family RNA polymerase sigma factor [Fuerstiella sp.]MDG2129986.1 sigma-70 family RNA polymerase sigma factor [Fuerstiella sp.]